MMQDWLAQLVPGLPSVDLRSATIAEIRGWLAALPNQRRLIIGGRVEHLVASPSELRDASLRINVVKLLVALLPSTLPTIERVLERRQNRHDFELHFTLFCYLDETQQFETEQTTVGQILQLVESYLMCAESDTAYAAWMAGDLLGDHWEPSQAIESLAKVLGQGRYRVARKAAVMGLVSLARRAENQDLRPRVRAILRQVAEEDRSADVRSSAELALAE